MVHFESKVYFSFPISSLEFLEQRVYIYLILLHFALLCFANIEHFYKLKVCGNPALTKYTGAIFPTAFAYFMSLYHILVIFTIIQTFSLLFCYKTLKDEELLLIDEQRKWFLGMYSY